MIRKCKADHKLVVGAGGGEGGERAMAIVAVQRPFDPEDF